MQKEMEMEIQLEGNSNSFEGNSPRSEYQTENYGESIQFRNSLKNICEREDACEDTEFVAVKEEPVEQETMMEDEHSTECMPDITEFLMMPPYSTSPEQGETETYKWTHKTTLIFLDLYKEYRTQVGSLKLRSLKKMFEEIAKELRHKTKQQVTSANCENRWKHLERTYKKYTENINKTGRSRKQFEYAEVMEEILGKKSNISPVLLLSSDSVSHPVEEERDSFLETNNKKENILEVSDKNKVTSAKTITRRTSFKKKRNRVAILKEIRRDRKDFYKKLLDIEEKKILEKQRKNKILEERNQLLRQCVLKGLPVLQMEDM